MSGENEPDDILEQETTKASREQPAALADMRHRLRTPLNHIIGYSEMLLEEASERGLETFAADLQKIHAAGKQLLLCLNELLDPAMMARGSVGRVSRTVTSAGPFREAEPDSRPLAAAAARISQPHSATSWLSMITKATGTCSPAVYSMKATIPARRRMGMTPWHCSSSRRLILFCLT